MLLKLLDPCLMILRVFFISESDEGTRFINEYNGCSVKRVFKKNYDGLSQFRNIV